MLVTPFIVRAVAQKDLSRPDEGTATSTTYPEADKAKLSDTGK